MVEHMKKPSPEEVQPLDSGRHCAVHITTRHVTQKPPAGRTVAICPLGSGIPALTFRVLETALLSGKRSVDAEGSIHV